MAKILKPPKPLVDGFSVFLAGSIEMGKAEDWQKKVEELFSDTDITIFNPRRDDWDSSWKQEIGNDKFREQVEWELDAQERANNIIMYFSPKTASPISLLELGLFARTGKMIVCCPEGYEKKGNVDIVCKRYNIPQVDTLEQAVEIIKNKVGENKMKEEKIREVVREIISEILLKEESIKAADLIKILRPNDFVIFNYPLRGSHRYPDKAPQQGKGRVRIKMPTHVVLNAGGQYGTPAVVDATNIVSATIDGKKYIAEAVLREDLSDTEPASKAQLWALFAATKKDYRNAGLSKKAAYDLLQKINAEKGYGGKKPTDFKKDLLAYLQAHSDKIAKKMRDELGIKSVVGHDPEMYGKEYADKQPKYAFFGGGMGFAWLEFDRRSQLAVAINKASKEIDDTFKKWFLNKYFTTKERDYYKKLGWPLEAMLFQSMSINAEIQKIVADYMESKGVKNVSLRTRLD